jgi:uncharacterized membrane protein YgaE (UPF0421/DUF939 family)
MTKYSGNNLLWLLLTELIVICLIISYKFINQQSAITLCLFTFLFGALIFQLNGTSTQKLITITVGNIIGLLWNYVFLNFSQAGSKMYAAPFDIFYTILYPFLNLMWVVPVWAVSLSLLPKPTCQSD